jgi:DNA-binding MarR family transcriptional regulator
MQEMGLVGRVRGGEDRRYVTARITRQGLSVLERLDQDICRIHRSQLGHLDRKMLRSLIDLLTAIRGGQQD